ncbi:hypothetical protein DFP73DRAFT_584327 [Morchella snyderi]|nr:hypothetical protein DFP73DRAFT_584327 [Morchella snyderi]
MSLHDQKPMALTLTLTQSSGVGLAVPMLLTISILFSIFAGLILSAKGVLYTVSIVVLLAWGLTLKHERDAAKEEEERRRREVEAERLRSERERRIQMQVQMEKERELRRLQGVLRQAEARQRRFIAEGGVYEQQQQLERTADANRPQKMGWFVNVLDAIVRAGNTVAAGSPCLDDRGIEAEEVGSSPLGGTCVICCVRAADTLVMPCKHLALCGACSDEMRVGSSGPEGKCPLCRVRIADKPLIAIPTSDSGKPLIDASIDHQLLYGNVYQKW